MAKRAERWGEKKEGPLPNRCTCNVLTQLRRGEQAVRPVRTDEKGLSPPGLRSPVRPIDLFDLADLANSPKHPAQLQCSMIHERDNL
jgi:hypothetical protein